MNPLLEQVKALPYTRGLWTAPHYSFSKRDVEKMKAMDNEPPRLLQNDGAMSVVAQRRGEDELNSRVCLVDRQTDCKRAERHQAPDEVRDANARVLAAAPLLLETAATAHDKLVELAKTLEAGYAFQPPIPDNTAVGYLGGGEGSQVVAIGESKGKPSDGELFLAGQLAAIAGMLSGAIMPAVRAGDLGEYGDTDLMPPD